MIVRRGIFAAPLCAVVLLAGCTDEDDPIARTTTTSTATTTTAPPLPPMLPNEAMQPSTQGAAAFFRYYWKVYNYAFRTLDSQPLEAIFQPSCKTCQKDVASIQTARAQQYQFRGGNVTVDVAVAAPGNPSQGLIVNSVINQTASSSVDVNGKQVDLAPGHTNLRLDGAVRWDGNRWTMLGIDVASAGH